MSEDNQAKDLAVLVELDKLGQQDQESFLAEFGSAVVESALQRLTAELSDEQVSALQQFLETEPDSTMLLKHLLEHHPKFETFLNEEAVALKEEAISVLE